MMITLQYEWDQKYIQTTPLDSFFFCFLDFFYVDLFKSLRIFGNKQYKRCSREKKLARNNIKLYYVKKRERKNKFANINEWM